mgnify:CR=1 FL=1
MSKNLPYPTIKLESYQDMGKIKYREKIICGSPQACINMVIEPKNNFLLKK